ncbi:MAG TPA: amino acid permease [Candidatus Dormibacteraeota bacterium]
MSPVEVITPEVAVQDKEELGQLGYRQELDRRLGSFSSFAAGFSYISILTGMFQLFAFGYAFGGPAMFWTWPTVLIGQMLVALCFAEYAATYPIAGSSYMWSRQIASRATSWMAGWLLVTGGIVTIAAVAVAWQVILPQIDSRFQFFGGTADIGSFSTPNGAKNAILLGCILIVITTIINCIGIRLMARINNIGVVCELVGASALIIVLATHIKRGPSVVTETLGTGSGHSAGYLGAFLLAILMSAYVMYGFDSAGQLAEETNQPRKRAPIAIIRALGAAGILGMLLILVALMAVGDINNPNIGTSGLVFIVQDTMSWPLYDIFLIDVMIAITVCCLAVQTMAIRSAFAMARDNHLPGGSVLARVSKTTRTPIVPSIAIGLLAIALLLINIGNQRVFTVVTSVAIIMFYMAYLYCTVPMLLARFTGRWPRPGSEGYFSLGRWGLPINIVAVLYGAGMVFNLAWPRAEVYGTDKWYYQYGAYVFVGGVMIFGAIYYYLVQRNQPFGILDEHQSAEAATVVASLRC